VYSEPAVYILGVAMSKAFTNEENESADVAPPPRPRLRPGEKRYVTPEGYRALQQELERLAAAGAAREPRAQVLAAVLADLTVVAPDPAQAGRAFFGAWVSLEDEDGGTAEYRIVGLDEVDSKAHLVRAHLMNPPVARPGLWTKGPKTLERSAAHRCVLLLRGLLPAFVVDPCAACGSLVRLGPGS
jgi:transcription elongation factor GreB